MVPLLSLPDPVVIRRENDDSHQPVYDFLPLATNAHSLHTPLMMMVTIR